MKPVYQTLFGGENGNCFQAALASVLELPIEAVPHFMLSEADSWWEEYEEWAEQFGLQPIAIDPNGVWKPRGWHLIIGVSPRGNFNHCIVGYAGKAVHDPHPDGGCELKETIAYEFFIQLNPRLENE